ncbi:MAG: 30S ribosomal protein S20 [Salinivirgaceae bacterium]|jgi:small subunit ribosomal protein S20|nr:30S ribosomal protein S20 [Bacteroidales bacterium]HOG20245.1 30S ribosomal protein S20 [Salinivirgaceae bacterium]
MANHKSAKKRVRQTERRRLYNRYYARTTRNAIKKLRAMTDKKEAQEALPKVVSLVDRLSKRGIIHDNKASNLKSKLTLFVNKL